MGKFFKYAGIRPLGFGSCSLAYTDGDNVVKEVYGTTPSEVETYINNFKNTYLPPKPEVEVLFPKVVNYNNRAFLVTPFIPGDILPRELGYEYFEDLVNYSEAKKKGLNYIDRGHANFIKTPNGRIVNFDPVPDLGENVKKLVRDRIRTSPNNRLSIAQRDLKRKLVANPREDKDPHLWRLIQNELTKRTKLTDTMFNEVVNG